MFETTKFFYYNVFYIPVGHVGKFTQNSEYRPTLKQRIKYS